MELISRELLAPANPHLRPDDSSSDLFEGDPSAFECRDALLYVEFALVIVPQLGLGKREHTMRNTCSDQRVSRPRKIEGL